MIRFAIFDADGVLLDSSPMWETLGERYILALGKTPENGLSERLNELTVAEGAEYLKSRYDIPKAPHEIAKELTAVTEDFYRHEVTLKGGVRELLKALDERNIPMAIATAGDKELTRAALVRTGVWGYFSGMATCAEFGAKTKPDVYLAAAGIIGAVPEQTVVFEDSRFAADTAKRAGFITAAVADISEHRRDKLQKTADYFAYDLTFYSQNINLLGF